MVYIQIRDAANELDFLRHVESVEKDDARIALCFRILRVNEVTRQAAALERHLDDFDVDVAQLRVAMKAIATVAPTLFPATPR